MLFVHSRIQNIQSNLPEQHYSGSKEYGQPDNYYHDRSPPCKEHFWCIPLKDDTFGMQAQAANYHCRFYYMNKRKLQPEEVRYWILIFFILIEIFYLKLKKCNIQWRLSAGKVIVNSQHNLDSIPIQRFLIWNTQVFGRFVLSYIESEGSITGKKRRNKVFNTGATMKP